MEPLETHVRAAERAFPQYAEALRLAFAYVPSDPGSSLTKSRLVAERLLIDLFRQEMGSEPRKALLGDLLADNQFTRRIDRRILSRLHAIRDMGNLGPHGEKVEPPDAARVLEDLCTVLAWHRDRTGVHSLSHPAGRRSPRWDPRKLLPHWPRAALVAFGTAALLAAYPAAFWWARRQETAERAAGMAEARRAIERQNRLYHETVAHGDPEGYARLFADDGVVLSKGEPIEGREKIREWAGRSWKPGVGPVIQTTGLDVRDDLAYEIGLYTRGPASGSYLVVWKKQPDGQWRIQAEVASVKPSEAESSH